MFMDARYEGPNLSRFLSQDPNFINAGAPDWVTGISGDSRYLGVKGFVDSSAVYYLSNPQNLNSYSYVDNNPLENRDPDGKCPQCLVGADAAMVGQYGYDVANNIQQNGLTLSDFYTNLSSPQTYLLRAWQGIAIAATAGAAAGNRYFRPSGGRRRSLRCDWCSG